jgi:signal transduction histidine kinase
MDPHASRVLGAVLAAVADAAGYPDVLYRICVALGAAVPCDRVTIYTASRRTRSYLPRADHGTPPHVVRRFVRRGIAPWSFAEASELAAGRVFSVSRGTASPEMRAILLEAELAAITMLPMLFEGETEGTISCGLVHAAEFTPDQIDALQHVASHVAILVRNARLESDTRRLAARRTALAEWAAHVLTSTGVPDIAERLAQMAREVFRASGAWVLMIEGDDVVGRQASGPERGREEVRIPLATSSASTDAIRSGRVLVVNDFAKSEYIQGAVAQRFRPASVLVAPLVDDGGPLGAVMVHDLEHPRRFRPTDEEDARVLASIATAALRKVMLVDALTRANQAKSEFLASVSHDLRTPLNIITGYAQLLREETFGPLTGEQSDTLGRLLRTAGDQLALINDLLDLARIEQGKLACTPESMALAGLVPPLADMMHELLRDRPVRFEADVPAGIVAHADPERVRQVLVNLLTNAAKFTNEGCVRLAAALDPDGVRVSVVDTGCGIDAGLRDRVLEPFVRGSSPQAGTGLGLAIVARLLAAMHGTIAIDSDPGRGTRIEVVLPRGPRQASSSETLPAQARVRSSAG